MDIFQKLEKGLRKIHQKKIDKHIFVPFIFFLEILVAQVDQRFDLFDWEIMRQNESINSISEGYQYVFFATNANGILRFNKFSRKFDSNIYLGQEDDMSLSRINGLDSVSFWIEKQKGVDAIIAVKDIKEIRVGDYEYFDKKN